LYRLTKCIIIYFRLCFFFITIVGNRGLVIVIPTPYTVTPTQVVTYLKKYIQFALGKWKIIKDYLTYFTYITYFQYFVLDSGRRDECPDLQWCVLCVFFLFVSMNTMSSQNNASIFNFELFIYRHIKLLIIISFLKLISIKKCL